MAGKSTYLQNALLNWIRGTTMPAAPSAVYVALFSADPTDAGSTANEVTTTVRPAGRVAASFGTVSSSSGTSTTANTAIIDFGTSAGTVNATWFGIFDAASGGNMLASNTLTGGNISSGVPVSFAVGALSWGES